MLVMNGHEVEFDLFELETAKKYENAFEEIMKKIEEAKEKKLTESIQIQCDAIRKCIDQIFGTGMGLKVCGEKYNLTKHLDAFEALVAEAIHQREDLNKRGSKYTTSQNREQRRKSQKEQKRNGKMQLYKS